MTPDLDAREPLDQLAEEFVRRHRAGERPTLSEYATRYPTWAEAIRDLFPTLLVMEEFGAAAAASPTLSRGGPAITDVKLPTRLGRYRLVRELGRGGMGVVFEAVLEPHNQRVALKALLPAAAPSPAHLERFRREAYTVARLRHPHIVPVFDVGEDQGVPYYTMRLIDGLGLDQVITEVKQRRRQGMPFSHQRLPESVVELTAAEMTTIRPIRASAWAIDLLPNPCRLVRQGSGVGLKNRVWVGGGGDSAADPDRIGRISLGQSHFFVS